MPKFTVYEVVEIRSIMLTTHEVEAADGEAAIDRAQDYESDSTQDCGVVGDSGFSSTGWSVVDGVEPTVDEKAVAAAIQDLRNNDEGSW